MDTSSSDGMSIACNSVGGSFPGPIDDQTQRTIGEAATSLVQLAKRYTRILADESDSLPLPSANDGAVLPFWCGGYRGLNNTTPLLNSSIVGDYISLFTYLYGFWAGGVRWRFLTAPVASTTIVTIQTPAPTNFPSFTDDSGFQGGIINGVTPAPYSYFGHTSFQNNLAGGFSINVPAYMKGRARAVDTSFNAGTDTAPAIFETSLCLKWHTIGADLGSDPYLYRAAADDFQLGMFVCVPPIMLSYTP